MIRTFVTPVAKDGKIVVKKLKNLLKHLQRKKRTNLIHIYVKPYGYRIVTEKEKEDIEWIQLMKSMKSNKF